MTRYLPLRKKIRGWKRRVKQVERWGEWIRNPDLKYYDQSGFTYDRCTLSPFYMLVKRHPPLWFYKLIIEQFIIALYEWDKVFQDRGEPYDLILWLYDPAFIRSEIICYKVDKAGERMRFSWDSDLDKQFPVKKFESKKYNIELLNWELGDDQNIHFESELEDEDFSAQDLLKEGFIKKTQNKNEIYYAQRVGDLWMGRIKST